MSTNYLPSIFNGGKSKTLSKRSTITSTKPIEETQPSNQRSTTISKVKRFGSLLVRNNKSERRRRADTIFPPQIDTTNNSSSTWSSTQESLVSSTDTTISTDDDDEEEVMTPTNNSMVSHMFEENRSRASTTAVNSSHHHHSNSSSHLVVMPEEAIETNQSIYDKPMTFDDKEITNEQKPDPEPKKKVIDPDTLSSVSLVRYHLEMAMAEIDQEIDDELEAQREHMLKNIQTRPTLLF